MTERKSKAQNSGFKQGPRRSSHADRLLQNAFRGLGRDTIGPADERMLIRAYYLVDAVEMAVDSLQVGVRPNWQAIDRAYHAALRVGGVEAQRRAVVSAVDCALADTGRQNYNEEETALMLRRDLTAIDPAFRRLDLAAIRSALGGRATTAAGVAAKLSRACDAFGDKKRSQRDAKDYFDRSVND